MIKRGNPVAAIASVVLGILLIILKNDVISIALTVLGAAVLISAIVDFTGKRTNSAVIQAVIGVCILVFGWVFVNLALYVFAAALLIVGLLQIVDIGKSGAGCPAKAGLTVYLKPAVTVLAGACLLLNQSGTIAWVFVVSGILLIAEGVLELIR